MAKKKDVEQAIEDLREALIASGQDPGLVDAQLFAVQPSTTNIVGNFADLQRAGGELIIESEAAGA